MLKTILLASAIGAMPLAAPSAAVLVADGITYSLTENSVSADGKTASFTMLISGENTASDTEGGRTGINAFALTQPSPGVVTAGQVQSPSGFNFALGGLNSSGCDGNGNFYCFDNINIPPTPTTALSGVITFNFTVLSNTAGVWTNYSPDFKIDWVGTKNNYDLVSLGIPVNYCTVNCGPPPPPPPPPPPVSEPMTLALLGTGLIGLGIARRRRAG